MEARGLDEKLRRLERGNCLASGTISQTLADSLYGHRQKELSRGGRVELARRMVRTGDIIRENLGDG